MLRSSRIKLLGISLLTLSILVGCIFTYYSKKDISTNQKYHAIIFDLDGTIINTDPLWKQAVFCTLPTYIPNHHQTVHEELTCSCATSGIYETVLEIINCLKNNHNVEVSVNEVFQECMPHLQNIYNDQGIEFIPHFETFHKKVQNARLKTAIATSSQKHIVEQIVTIVPLKNYFNEHIYHADHVNKAFKPKPDVYLHAAQQIGIQPQHCIAIEDTATGIKAAKAAGMYCIGINTGKNKDLLKDADMIVDCYSEIELEKLLFS